MASRVRLYVDHDLGAGQSVALSREQAHYLFGVMRISVHSEIEIFNGRDGGWLATVVEASKKAGVLQCTALHKAQQNPPDLWLLFAPIKKARTDFIVEKAAEMGASKILPVQTDFTNSERVRQDRLQAHALEAAEQCGGTFVPEVSNLQKLSMLLDTWPADRALMFCDEGLLDQPPKLPDISGPWAILIGPEGGFSPLERSRLNGHENAHPVSLGPRILRADTAAVAAMALWQSKLGDW